MATTKKSRRQKAVDKIMADTRLTGQQKARKISNLIKMTIGDTANVKSNQ